MKTMQAKLPRYNYILFDLDGTLFDYDKSEFDALKKTFEQFGFLFRSHFLAVYRLHNEQLWQAFENGHISQERLKIQRFEQTAETLGLQFNPEKFSAVYLANLAQGTDLIDGAEQLVISLNQKFELLLITNGLAMVQRPRIANSTIGKYFKQVIISEEVGLAKPDPQIFDLLFDKINRPPKKTVLLVGDSLSSDIRGGNQYGIDTCWFNPRGQSNDSGFKGNYEIRRLNELQPIVFI